MTPQERIDDARLYLQAISGSLRFSTLAELPDRLREIARNLEAIARGAEYDLNHVEEPDDY